MHEAEYNGLSWRTLKRADISAASGTIDGLDEMRVYIHSAGWQVLEERIDASWSSGFTADKVQQLIYGIRYIDDLVCRRIDGNADSDYTDSGDGDLTYYHLSDHQFSSVAVLDTSGKVLERVSYDSYGRPRHHRMGDLNGSGQTDVDDTLVVNNAWGSSGKGDLDRSGAVNVSDQLLVNNDYAAAAALAVCTSCGIGTMTAGWAGGWSAIP